MFKATLTLRPATENDLDFLKGVYASTRLDELKATGWTQAQLEEFLAMQFNAQHTFYKEQFAKADFDIVQCNGDDVGRLYLDDRDEEIRIVDIALLPPFRGLGLGTRLLNQVMTRADSERKLVRIHVEKNNPALTLYQRLGFTEVADKGVYLLMEKSPSAKVAVG